MCPCQCTRVDLPILFLRSTSSALAACFVLSVSSPIGSRFGVSWLPGESPPNLLLHIPSLLCDDTYTVSLHLSPSFSVWSVFRGCVFRHHSAAISSPCLPPPHHHQSKHISPPPINTPSHATTVSSVAFVVVVVAVVVVCSCFVPPLISKAGIIHYHHHHCGRSAPSALPIRQCSMFSIINHSTVLLDGSPPKHHGR